jgi:hypothetical protein
VVSRAFVRTLKKVLLLLTLLLIAVFTGTAWWRAHRALEEGAAQTAASGTLPFTLARVDLPIAPGFTAFSAAAEFQAAAAFQGDVYVCGRAALYRYSSAGKLLKIWHAGQELPPYPLRALTVRRGVATPELWIGTEGAGALIWDGQTFQQLRPQESGARKVSALLSMPNGTMLLGTPTAGLYSTDGKQLWLFHAQLAKVKVTALAGGQDALWIGTQDEGVWLWRAGTVRRFETELPDQQVLSLWSEAGSTWVGTPLGVAEFTNGEFSRRLASGVFARAVLAQNGKLWISSFDEGIFRLDLHARVPRPGAGEGFANGLDKSATALTLLDGQVVAVTAQALHEAARGGELLSAPAANLASGHIAALQVDAQRRLWIGYFDRGVDVLSLSGETTVQHFEDDVLFCVNRIKQEPGNGNILVGTANGLALFGAGGRLRQVLNARSGLIANQVTDILFQRTAEGGARTVIATPAGLTFIEGANVSSVYAFQGLVNNHVYTLAESGGTLVAGTLGGVSLLKNGLVQASFTTANSSLRQNWITASATAGKAIYLGTYGSGVIRMDEHADIQTFREFAGARVEVNPNALLITARAVYAGTAGRGMAILRRGQERWQFVTAGLPSRNVTALAADDDFLYIGTDNGLAEAAERNLLR